MTLGISRASDSKTQLIRRFSSLFVDAWDPRNSFSVLSKFDFFNAFYQIPDT